MKTTVLDGGEIEVAVSFNERLHTILIPPGADPTERLAALNGSMAKLGYDLVTEDDWQPVTARMNEVQTAEVIEAWNAREPL